MIGILLLVVVLIVHVCLYPWQFTVPAVEGGPLTLFLHSWPRYITRRTLLDVVANVALYVPLGLSAWLSIAGRRGRVLASAASLALGAALSFTVEIAQLHARYRVCNLLDWVANVSGTAAGVVLGMSLVRFNAGIPRLPMLVPPGGAGAGVLLLGWVLYQTCPFFPETHRYTVLGKLRQLLSPAPFSVTALFVSTAEWIAVGALARSLWSTRRASVILVLLTLLLPARLLIIERSVSWAELSALPLAFAALGALPSAGARRALAVVIALCAGLAVSGLAPFRASSSAAVFRWAPFGALIESDPALVLPLLLRKVFRYGALVWFLRSCAFSYPLATGFAAAYVALIEFAQLYIAGHVAEVTDPLLVVLAALVLAGLQREDRRPNRRASPPAADGGGS